MMRRLITLDYPQISKYKYNFSNHIFDGERLTDNFYQYQIFDIISKPVRDFIQSLDKNVQLSEIDGWLPNNSINQIRDMIKLRWEVLIKREFGISYQEFHNQLSLPHQDIVLNDFDNDKSDEEDFEYDIWDYE